MGEGLRIIRVAAAIVQRDGRYLIAKRKPGTHLGGLWEFPGGKQEPGEPLEACLRRELREELAIEITAPEPFKVIRHEYPDKTVELNFFRCSIAGGQPRPLGCEEVRWVTPGELLEVVFPPADRSVIQALAERRETGGAREKRERRER